MPDATRWLKPRELSVDEWDSFLVWFSAQHEGWLTTLEIGAPGLTPRVAARDLPLGGVMMGAAPGGTRQVCLALEAAPGGTEEFHLLPEPTHIWLARVGPAERELSIELRRGSIVRLVCTRVAARVLEAAPSNARAH